MLLGWGTVFYLCAADADVEWESSSCPSASCDSFCTPEQFCPRLCSLNTPAGSWTLRVLFKCVIQADQSSEVNPKKKIILFLLN